MPSLFKFRGPCRKAGGNDDFGMGLKYQSPLRSGSIDFVLSLVNTFCFPEVCVDLFRKLYTFPWNFGCKKSHLVMALVDVLVASIKLLLDIRVSAIGIESSLAICARISSSSGTGDVVGPVGISVSCDISCCVVSNCCVIAAGLLCGVIAVVCGETGIGKL